MLNRAQTPANIENATGISVTHCAMMRGKPLISTGRVIKRQRILTSLEVSVRVAWVGEQNVEVA